MWSVELPGPAAGALLVDASGGCLVASRYTLVSVAPDGRLAWEARTDEAFEPPVLGPAGELYRIEGARLVTRTPETGAVTGAAAAGRAVGLVADPWDGVVFRQVGPDGPVLRSMTRAGATRWTVPLGQDGGGPPPAVADDMVMVHFDGLLHALDRTGAVRWVAGHNGFLESGTAEPTAAEVADEQVVAPRPLDATVLVGLEWSDGGGLFRLDPAARTATRFAPWLPVPTPVVVVPGRTGFRVAARGPRREIRRFEWEWPVVLLDPDGVHRWSHPFPAEPLHLNPGAEGAVIVAASPGRDRWDRYRRWQDLSAEVFVACVDAGGERRWTWTPPGPVSHPPVVRPDGVVYVGSGGRLWALVP